MKKGDEEVGGGGVLHRLWGTRGHPAGAGVGQHAAGVWLWLLAITAVALVLRVAGLGAVFDSSDECELAYRILKNPGWGWMLDEPYGLVISAVVKLFAGFASALGVTMTELVWKLPVALAGAAQPAVTYALLRRLGGGRAAGLWGAGLMAVLPAHVDQSRYLWGYETLGLLCLSAALWALARFYERPEWGRGLGASLAIAVYLVSHGYIVPFAPCLLAAAWLLYEGEERGPWRRAWAGLRLLIVKGVWVLPLLAAPLCRAALLHTWRKPSQPGFYLLDHLGDYVSGGGVLLGALAGVAAVVGLAGWKSRGRGAALLGLCGAFYAAPLVFGAPPGITVVSGYLLLTLGLWAGALGLMAGRLASRWPGAVRVAGAVVVVVTLWGDVNAVFAGGRWRDPNRVVFTRGGTERDPGTKAAAWLVRTYCPDAKVLAIHRSVEPPCLYYYFGLDRMSFYDLPLEAPGRVARPGRVRDTREALKRFYMGADIVLCEPGQAGWVEATGRFERRVTLTSGGERRMLVFARPGSSLPDLSETDTARLNRAFDRDFAPKAPLR
ncbi:MAG TPA: glycosyltransferase family 39 protein [Candidatus Brocadiia bacterium]|nr:glycosyltransferase family 39 protein [Candidatus Brocadiia bacterium]